MEIWLTWQCLVFCRGNLAGKENWWVTKKEIKLWQFNSQSTFTQVKKMIEDLWLNHIGNQWRQWQRETTSPPFIHYNKLMEYSWLHNTSLIEWIREVYFWVDNATRRGVIKRAMMNPGERIIMDPEKVYQRAMINSRDVLWWTAISWWTLFNYYESGSCYIGEIS